MVCVGLAVLFGCGGFGVQRGADDSFEVNGTVHEVGLKEGWVIDLGPGGGKDGGHLVFAGTPEDLAKVKTSQTGKYLKEKL